MWFIFEGQDYCSACKDDSARFEKASWTSALSILGCVYAATEVEFISHFSLMHSMFHIENVTHACCTIVRDLELITASLRHERGCCLFVPSSAASKAQLQCQKLSILEVRTADELLHIDYSYGHNEYF